jgi:acyl-CoA synthetase (AMP-forming)/AMP-acid ligase II
LSAANIRRALRLTSSDRCLNVMPLLDVHGLIGALLASIAAGASVWCMPGFEPLRFFAAMEQARATWYTGVAAMHQAVVTHAAGHRETIARHPLRFIRASPSALPPELMRELETAFSCPVIESYGVIEAAHQMTSNPLPPQPRKPGTVGIAAGPEVAVLDTDNRILPPHSIGEVCVRGRSVTSGYLGAAAGDAAFAGGWFHTGDFGVMDRDGYLTITGRRSGANEVSAARAPRDQEELQSSV